MKKNLISFAFTLAGIFFWGCQDKEEIKPDAASAAATSQSNVTSTNCCANPELIDFNKYSAGTILSEVTSTSGVGPILVSGFNPKKAGNAAMIFNSTNPTGGDPDLKTPGYNNQANLQKVLIVSEDLNSGNPDDSDFRGSSLTFDFAKVGPVNICSFDVIDLEASQNEASEVEFYGANGKISEAALPLPGDNGVATGNYNVAGVLKMVIILNGSGAVDNIKFCVPVQPPTNQGCTRTQGYWKTHSKYGPAKPYNTTWKEIGENTIFFKSGKSYYQVITTPPSGGNAYYILAHQYIAARLNVLSKASAPKEVTDALKRATELFNTHTPAYIASLKSSSSVRKEFIKLAEILDKYNNGIIGPGHCK